MIRVFDISTTNSQVRMMENTNICIIRKILPNLFYLALMCDIWAIFVSNWKRKERTQHCSYWECAVFIGCWTNNYECNKDAFDQVWMHCVHYFWAQKECEKVWMYPNRYFESCMNKKNLKLLGTAWWCGLARFSKSREK